MRTILQARAEDGILDEHYTCDGCGKVKFGKRVPGGWFMHPVGWFVYEDSKTSLVVCSAECIAEAEMKDDCMKHIHTTT